MQIRIACILFVLMLVIAGCGGGGGGNGSSTTTPTGLTIRAGQGIGNVNLGYTPAQVQSILGAPTLDWGDIKGYKGMTAAFKNGVCIHLTYDYSGRDDGVSANTPGGITIDSTLDQVKAEFGQPEQVESNYGTIYYYPSRGIRFSTWYSGENAGKVSFIHVFRPGNPDGINW